MGTNSIMKKNRIRKKNIDKIINLLVWYYSHAEFNLIQPDHKKDEPIPLNLLTSDEKDFIVKYSLLNSLLN